MPRSCQHEEEREEKLSKLMSAKELTDRSMIHRDKSSKTSMNEQLNISLSIIESVSPTMTKYRISFYAKEDKSCFAITT